MSRKLESGTLRLKCDKCNCEWEEHTRDYESPSSLYCPECGESDPEEMFFIKDEEWKQ